MTGFWWLLLGLLGGWLIELAIDYTWWRKRHRAAADEAARRLGEIDQVRKDLDSRDARLALREMALQQRRQIFVRPGLGAGDEAGIAFHDRRRFRPPRAACR